MEVGYNLVTFEAIKDGRYKRTANTLSVVDFLRGLKKGNILEEASVVGFEYLLYYSKDFKETANMIRELLRENSGKMFQSGSVIQLIVSGNLSKNKGYILTIREKRIPLSLIFSNRLEYRDVDWFHAPPNIP